MLNETSIYLFHSFKSSLSLWLGNIGRADGSDANCVSLTS